MRHPWRPDRRPWLRAIWRAIPGAQNPDPVSGAVHGCGTWLGGAALAARSSQARLRAGSPVAKKRINDNRHYVSGGPRLRHNEGTLSDAFFAPCAASVPRSPDSRAPSWRRSEPGVPAGTNPKPIPSGALRRAFASRGPRTSGTPARPCFPAPAAAGLRFLGVYPSLLSCEGGCACRGRPLTVRSTTSGSVSCAVMPIPSRSD